MTESDVNTDAVPATDDDIDKWIYDNGCPSDSLEFWNGHDVERLIARIDADAKVIAELRQQLADSNDAALDEASRRDD